MFIDAPLRNLRDRMLAIRGLPNFAGLGDESLLRIAEHARERRFRAGQELFREGEAVDRIYIVLSGAVTTSRQGKTFMVITGNGALGILAAIAHDPIGWHAVADRETLTLEIPVTVFLASLKEDFGLLRNALRRLSTMALESRGNLPATPDPTRRVDMGVYPDRDPTLVELIIQLRTVPGPFATANMDALIAAARRMTLHRVDAGHVFFEIGQPSDHTLRVVYGRVRCVAGSGGHVDVGAGFVLGALDSWADAHRSFSARAETPVVCYRTPMEDLLSVLEMHPSLALNMIQGIAAALIKSGLTR